MNFNQERSFKSLTNELLGQLEEKGLVLVGIDGRGGAGKSTYARYLAERIS